MKRREFRIGILGLTQVERITVKSVCSLTQSRSRIYHVLAAEDCVDADIMIVDADDERACQLWNASPPFRAGRPVLLISRQSDSIASAPYALPRTSFAARLIRMLDRITLHEFDGVGATVGETGDTGFGAEDFIHTGAMPPLSSMPRALVVDDSLIVQARMRALLSLNGLSADLVDSAEQGLALMAVNRYAIVFLEAALPGMDGYAACRQMKATDRAFTPIVMLTSRSSALDRIRGLMAGCNRYLAKPIAVQTLHKVLHEFIPEETLSMATGAFAAMPVRES